MFGPNKAIAQLQAENADLRDRLDDILRRLPEIIREAMEELDLDNIIEEKASDACASACEDFLDNVDISIRVR